MKWNSALYDNNHEFVSRYGEAVIELLDPKVGELILDLGCGTGDLAALIGEKGASVIGIDNSEEMILAAKKKYPGIQFDTKSADNFQYDVQFDAVFSNATLHWVLEKEKAIRCIYNALKPGGRFVTEFGGKGNVANIINALENALKKWGHYEMACKSIWYFPSLSEYTSLLEQNCLRVFFAAHFDRETLLKDDNGIKNWIRMFGQSYLQGLNEEVIENILEDVEEQLKLTNFRNGNWYADYVRLRVVALKQ